ncbi:MAG: stage II sporulation protein R [Ruminiclostridium sp.]
MTGNFLRNILDKAMIAVAVLGIIISGFSAFAQDCEEKPDEVLRLHILANSDSNEDQQLKYDLRDYILSNYGEVFSECTGFEDSVKAAKLYKSEIEQAANEFVRSKGYNYKVKCEIGKTYFTTRKYENYTLPAGEYTAVRLLIGNAEGKNWWCVMFPPLCLPAAGEFFTEDQSKRIEESRDIEVKFALFEAIQNLISGGEDNSQNDEPQKEENSITEESEHTVNDFVQIGIFGVISCISA